MVRPMYAELSLAGRTVRLSTGGPSRDGLALSSEGIEGWHSTPDAKVSMTERRTGDGAHAVAADEVLYAARVVTLHWVALGVTRDGALSGVGALLSCAHRLVRLRVADAGSDTWVEGYATVSSEAGVASRVARGTLTVTCPDPRRLSVAAHECYLSPVAGSSMGGLSFGPSALGLAYPLGFGTVATGLASYGTLLNSGSSRAYPVLTVNGAFDGVRVDFSGGSGVSTLSWDGHVGAVPLVLDCRSRRATIAGLDVSQHLTSRGFPVVAPGGSLSCSLQSAGTGWVAVESRDTYI